MFVQVLKQRTGLMGSYTVILLKLLLNFLVFVFPFCRKMQELSGEATPIVLIVMSNYLDDDDGDEDVMSVANDDCGDHDDESDLRFFSR